MLHSLITFLIFGIDGAASLSTYRAAVVEFAPQRARDLDTLDVNQARHIKLQNLNHLEGYANQAKRNGTQIMVFPEYGITGDGGLHADFTRNTTVPFLEEPPEVGSNPCGDVSRVAIAKAACLARDLEMVLVINILTKKPCELPGIHGCPADGMYLHNTAIAYNETGAVLSVYFKRHPYGDEVKFVDAGGESMKDGVTFTTSFGVKFGMFICFDMIFFTDGGPDAREIVYPTDWVNDVLGPIPEPLSARNAQRVWSGLHRKNLIAANYGGFGKDSSGSGIWNAGKEVASFFNPTRDPQNKLLIADLPVLPAETLV